MNMMQTSCWKTCRQHKSRNESVISFLAEILPNKQKRTQQWVEADSEKQSADEKAGKSYAKKFQT